MVVKGQHRRGEEGSGGLGVAFNFLGANVPNNLTNKQFAFSLTNPLQNGNHLQYTASFTSSYDVVPEPISMIALATGLVAVARRRKA